jgi:hypothetical protein
MGLIEAFGNGFMEENKEENKEGQSFFKKNLIVITMVLVKLLFIYIVMLLWPRVMPKLLPSITKQPSYINLLGLSVILSLL